MQAFILPKDNDEITRSEAIGWIAFVRNLFSFYAMIQVQTKQQYGPNELPDAHGAVLVCKSFYLPHVPNWRGSLTHQCPQLLK
jgi:hypothetical protein